MKLTEVEKRIRATFNAQVPTRKKYIKKILMKRIQTAVNTNKVEKNGEFVDDPCRDAIDDLPLDKLDLDLDKVGFVIVWWGVDWLDL